MNTLQGHINHRGSTLREVRPHEEILGALLTKPDLLKEYHRKLHPRYFADYEWLYRLILEVEEQEGLTFKGLGMRCEVDQLSKLHELRQTFISESRVPILIQQLKDRELENNIRRLANQVLLDLDADTANDMLRELQRASYELHTTDTGELFDMEQEVDDFIAYVEMIMQDPGKAYGLLTGIPDMDTITTGWHKQELIVVGARTSMGKSAFMLDNVLRLHKAGYKCAIFSLEMSKKQIHMRMMANLMGVSLETLRLGQLAPELIPRFRAMSQSLKGIYVDDTRGVDSEYITDVMRRLKRTQGLDFVVVDYLQDVKEKGEANDNQGSALGRICRKLRTAAQQVDVPVMALSQVTRAVEERKEKRPTNSDLSGSTGIETSADVIALLYRDEYYNKDTSQQNVLEVNFTKQRNGKLGKVELHYDKDSQRITPLGR